MITATKKQLFGFIQKNLGSLQSSGSTPGTRLTLSFANLTENYLNDGVVDSPTNLRFRALVAGYYRFNYKIIAYASTALRGMEFRALKNGVTELTGSVKKLSCSNITATRGSSTATFSGIYLLADNDYIEVQVNPVDSTVINVLSETCALLEYIGSE